MYVYIVSCLSLLIKGVFPFTDQVPRDVPGIDAAHLAMDTEDGVEVVWNEVRYSSRKSVSASKVHVHEHVCCVIHTCTCMYVCVHAKVYEHDGWMVKGGRETVREGESGGKSNRSWKDQSGKGMGKWVANADRSQWLTVVGHGLVACRDWS